MSEVVENVSEQKNSANTKEVTALPTKAVEDVTTNNVEAAVEAVPEGVENVISATNEITDDSGSKKGEEKSSTSPNVDNKKTPVKRTPSKRRTFIERAQKESEELVKNMGGSLEIEGGRRTRSSTRGTPTRSPAASTPPPAKKARSSPASGATTPTRPRGRGRKIDVADDTAEEGETKATPIKKKSSPTKGKKAAAKNNAEEEDDAEEQLEEAKEEKEKTEEKEDGSKETKDFADNKVIENIEEDKTDAALEPVVEETQSQVAADLLSNEQNVTKGPDSTSAPVDKDPQVSESVQNDNAKPVESVTKKIEKTKPEETTTTVVNAVQKIKEPTPEPMEIDSNSKSNDALEPMEDDVIESNETETEVVQEPVKSLENQQSVAEIKTANWCELNNVGKFALAATPAGVVTNNSIAKTADVTDGADANANENNTEEIKPAANDLKRNENDLCEPKIATSPQISATNENNTVTTPQTCN